MRKHCVLCGKVYLVDDVDTEVDNGGSGVPGICDVCIEDHGKKFVRDTGSKDWRCRMLVFGNWEGCRGARETLS